MRDSVYQKVTYRPNDAVYLNKYVSIDSNALVGYIIIQRGTAAFVKGGGAGDNPIESPMNPAEIAWLDACIEANKLVPKPTENASSDWVRTDAEPITAPTAFSPGDWVRVEDPMSHFVGRVVKRRDGVLEPTWIVERFDGGGWHEKSLGDGRYWYVPEQFIKHASAHERLSVSMMGMGRGETPPPEYRVYSVRCVTADPLAPYKSEPMYFHKTKKVKTLKLL